MKKILFSSESVGEGHPDKVCDRIADSILDCAISQDSEARVACEVLATKNTIVIAGEITADAIIDFEKIVKDTLKDIGYDKEELGCDYHSVNIINLVNKQSEDISIGIKKERIEDTGAGDQGMMFGYACKESDGYMPLAIVMSHKLVRVASTLRKQNKFKGARPDMKAQVTIDYTDKNNARIDTILMSCSHDENVNLDEFKKFIHNEIMVKVAKSFNMNTDFKYYINPTGKFVICGPTGDTGLTGRKIIIDTYGGSAEHGGGSFSGKDPTKVDRTGAYMARYIAKNLVAAGVADTLQVQICYGIGMSKPISIGIKTYKSAKYSDEKILSIIDEVFDCRPGMIIKNFSLTKPTFKYSDLANYGHFGRPDLNLPWEKLDKVEEIKKLLK